MNALLEMSPAGMFSPAGGFHIDPWRPVPLAVVTHAHSDHLTANCGRYLCSTAGEALLRLRAGDDANIQSLDYEAAERLQGVRLSLHPAGHVLGSAQVRLENDDHVVVVAGDYKTDHDPTCVPFHPLTCDTFITESTFGLPIFRWPKPARVIADIEAWWRSNQAAGKASILLAYALGKAQRVLASVSAAIGPIYTHGAVERVCEVYRASGVALPATELAVNLPKNTDWSAALILAPPSAMASPWLRRFGRISTGMVSGWMRVRGIRRRRAIDRGFVLSDHADWPALLRTIDATGARHIGVTHGYTAAMSRYLIEQGQSAFVLPTEFRGEDYEDDSAEADA